MINGIRLKVCGLTSLVDAEAADHCGADFLGFILYARSPRCVSLNQYRAMAARLPARKKVAVTVAPSADELAGLQEAGFDFFQVHFGANVAESRLAEWSRQVGKDRLWLAPKLPPATDVSPAARSAANYIVMDTYQAAGFGGSGQTGDWGRFARHRTAFPDSIWILAGGLNADNIGTAVEQSGARFVDVNSGVESAPGIKDPAKLREFARALRRAAVAGT